MRASVGSCESMRGLDQHGDDGELVFVAGGVEHDGGWRDQTQSRYRVNLGPARVRCLAGDIKGQHRVKAVVGRWMQVGELALDQERLGRSDRLAGSERERASSGDGDPAGLLDNPRE